MDRFAAPATTRSRLILETVSELVGASEWTQRQALVHLRRQGTDDWTLALLASDTPEAVQEVAAGRAQVAIINPAAPLTLALRGTGPFREPIPLRAIGVIPSEDQMGFAVAARTGLTSFEEIAERRYPLRLSLRSQPKHACHLFVRETLGAIGVTLEDLVAWGGEVSYDAPIAHAPPRMNAAARGEIDAIFDEAVNLWANDAMDSGLRFLPLGEPLLAKLEAVGFRRAPITRKDYPKLPADVMSLDFSGWAVYTRADVPEDFIYAFCAALDARKDRIPWQGEGPLPVERMCRDTPDTPLAIPLHPGAERYWRERGYLG
jgi:hypothetical protein